MTGHTQTLICPGVQGAGKTFLTAIVVDALRKRIAADVAGIAGIAVLYCNYQKRDEYTARVMLSALVGQLLVCRCAQAVAAALLERYFAHGRPRVAPPLFDDLSCVLRDILAAAQGRVFVLVDALDEGDAAQWLQLVAKLRCIQNEHPGLRLMLTMRPHLDYGNELEFDRGSTALLTIEAHSEDLRRFLRTDARRLSRQITHSAELMSQVVQGIMKAAGSM